MQLEPTIGIDNVQFHQSQCVHLLLQIGWADLPGDAGITAVPGKTYPLGSVVTVNLTVTANGPGSSGDTGINLLFPTEMNLQDVVVADPAGLGA